MKELIKQITDYIKKKYPVILFSVGIDKLKNSIIILEFKEIKTPFPFDNERYYSLVLNIKTSTPFRKGSRSEIMDKYKRDVDVLFKLKTKGFMTYFVWSFEDAKKYIDNYLNENS